MISICASNICCSMDNIKFKKLLHVVSYINSNHQDKETNFLLADVRNKRHFFAGAKIIVCKVWILIMSLEVPINCLYCSYVSYIMECIFVVVFGLLPKMFKINKRMVWFQWPWYKNGARSFPRWHFPLSVFPVKSFPSGFPR